MVNVVHLIGLFSFERLFYIVGCIYLAVNCDGTLTSWSHMKSNFGAFFKVIGGASTLTRLIVDLRCETFYV